MSKNNDWFGASDYKRHGVGRCYTKHPALILPGTKLSIWGGSCINPVVSDADVYIGFDRGMHHTARSWPWKQGHDFLFAIDDMHPPSNVAEFNKLLDWTGEQLADGKKVHCGCIGGHGRTGTFLAALVAAHGEKDAIAYVREHYCPKAVETSGQVSFLVSNYGIKSVAGSKASRYDNFRSNSSPAFTGASYTGHRPSREKTKYEPMQGSPFSIW